MACKIAKLNYLNETKELIKQAIDPFGTIIAEDTPFRQYVDIINSDSGDNSETTDSFLDGTITEISSDTCASLGNSSLRDLSVLKKIDCPNVTYIGRYTCYSCESLETVNCPKAETIAYYAFAFSGITTADFPSATMIEERAFSQCTNLTSVNFPALETIGDLSLFQCAFATAQFPTVKTVGKSGFRENENLTTVDLSSVESLGDYCFYKCSSLTTLIIRSSSVPTLGSYSPFYETPIVGGTGFIYVPSSLIDSYKAASNWSTYAAQFRAIEDYPEICG